MKFVLRNILSFLINTSSLLLAYTNNIITVFTSSFILSEIIFWFIMLVALIYNFTVLSIIYFGFASLILIYEYIYYKYKLSQSLLSFFAFSINIIILILFCIG